MLLAVLVAIAAAAIMGLRPAEANPVFAQTAQQPCLTCHQAGQENSAPYAGFTTTGQNIYSAFSTNGTSCSYNVAAAIASQLSVGGAAVVPCSSSAGPTPSYQPNQPSYPPAPQPNPNFQPTYPVQPGTPVPPQPIYPSNQPTYPPAPQPAYPPQPNYQPQQNYYPPQPAPYTPQYGPAAWTQPHGKLFEFEPFCIFSGKAYFTVKMNGSDTDVLHFTLTTSNKVRIDVPVGSQWQSDCQDYPANGANWLTVF